MSFMHELSAKNVAIIGAGVTGSALLDFFITRGINADLYDEKAPGALREVNSAYDLAVVSPGWRTDHPIIVALETTGCEILSEIDFSWKVKEDIAPDQKWIALTGTNGKTTTIQMVQSIFDYSTKSGIACGNVGEPVISVLASGEKFDYLALELSSFQLQVPDQQRP